MISDAEDEMEEMCDAAGATASTSSALCKSAVKALVKAEILDRGIFDNQILKALDRTSFRDDITSEKLREYAESKVKKYAETYGGADDAYPESIGETIVRQDHEMPEYNPDQSKIKEYHDQASDTNNQDTDNP